MTVTNIGLAEMANLVIGGGTAFSYIAIGTGTTAATVGDTALETEVQRESATTSRVTTNTSNDTSQWVYTFNFSGAAAITEYGVLNADTAGTLLLHIVDSAVNVNDGDSLQVTIKLVGDQA
jgi:hypothetical protein